MASQKKMGVGIAESNEMILNDTMTVASMDGLNKGRGRVCWGGGVWGEAELGGGGVGGRRSWGGGAFANKMIFITLPY